MHINRISNRSMPSKRNRKMVFAKQLRYTYHRDANVERRLARNRDLFRRGLGRTQWKARYTDVCDSKGNVLSATYLGHHIVQR